MRYFMTSRLKRKKILKTELGIFSYYQYDFSFLKLSSKYHAPETVYQTTKYLGLDRNSFIAFFKNLESRSQKKLNQFYFSMFCAHQCLKEL